MCCILGYLRKAYDSLDLCKLLQRLKKFQYSCFWSWLSAKLDECGSVGHDISVVLVMQNHYAVLVLTITSNFS